MKYSLKDIYPDTGESVPTIKTTIPEEDENRFYNDSTVNTPDGQVLANKNLILGSVGLLVIMLVLLNFLD